MSELEDLLEDVNSDLNPPFPAPFTPPLGVETQFLKVIVQPDILECWTRDNKLLFRGGYNERESGLGKMQYGKGFHGLSIVQCESGEWCSTFQSLSGRGDTVEDSLDAMFEEGGVTR